MLEAILLREEQNEHETCGVLAFPGTSQQLFYTLERPWMLNLANISCIPAGTYRCELRKSPRFGYTYWLRGTAPRTFILIHAGNLVKHTHGCILPGLRKGRVKSGAAVFNSRSALKKIYAITERHPFQLRIENHV